MCKFIQKGVLIMKDNLDSLNYNSELDISLWTIEEYVKFTMTKPSKKEADEKIVKRLKDNSKSSQQNNGYKSQFYAIQILLQYVCGKSGNEDFSDFSGRANTKDGNPGYNKLNKFICFKIETQEDDVRDQTCKKYFTMNNIDNVIGKITYNDTIFDFFAQILENIGNRKEMKEYIKDAFGINMDDRLMKNKLKKLIENGTKQIILHGAPGTGKTFTAENFAEEYVKNLYEGLKKNNPDLKEDFKKFKDKYIKKVQFHPSFDYTDFVEGLRPAIIEKDKTDKSPTFVRMDGILKKFCRKIIENNDSNNLYFLLIDEINRADLSKVLGDLMYLMNDPQRSKKDKDEEKTIETPYSNMPTYIVDDNGNGKFLEKHKGNNKTENDQKEIDKKGNNKEDVFEDGFFLPDNLIIIGTMNDIDRSVDAFDFALRRRFVWIEADANTEAEDAIPNIISDAKQTDILITRLEELNKVISGDEGKKLGLSEKYHIGHAYAKNFDGSYDTLWENSIKPVLEDYCLGKKNKETFITACRNAFFDEKNPQDNQASSGN